MMRRLRLSVFALLIASTGCNEPFSARVELEMTVWEELQDCEDFGGPTNCMVVSSPPESAPQLFHDPIEGFVFEPGYRQRIRVVRFTVKNPPQDGSSYEYRLLEVIAKMNVSIEPRPASETAPN